MENVIPELNIVLGLFEYVVDCLCGVFFCLRGCCHWYSWAFRWLLLGSLGGLHRMILSKSYHKCRVPLIQSSPSLCPNQQCPVLIQIFGIYQSDNMYLCRFHNLSWLHIWHLRVLLLRIEVRLLGMPKEQRQRARRCERILSKHDVALLLNLTRMARVIIEYSVWVGSTITGLIVRQLRRLPHAPSLSKLVSSQCWSNSLKKSANE